MKRVVVAVLAAVFLLVTGCGDPVSGTVVSQNHRQAWTELYSQPMYGTRCYRSSTGGQNCTQTVTGYYPATRFHPEEWQLVVQDVKGKNHTVGVHRQTWLNKPVGSSFTET